MIDYQRIYHIGVRVPDIDSAMKEMGEGLGLTWATVQFVADRSLWTPETGLVQVELTFVYSCEGPQHVELLQGQPGTPWHCGDQPGVHHVGVWCDDIPAETARLTTAGWRVAAAASSPEDGYGSFAYLVPPSGTVVELVTARARERFEAWFAGGLLGQERR